MKVIYRACGYPSTKPLPYNWDKPTLLENCLESFIATGAKDITFLLDGVENKEMFEKYGEIIDCTGLGNVGTFHKQLELGQQHDKVFLVEDDYLWRPDTFKHMERAVDELDFVSPYDHPGHYLEERFDKHYEMKLIDNITYREAPSNTLTFATKGETIKKLYSKMLYWGVADHEMFQDLRSQGYRMWNPVPSFATHLVDGLLAPNINWKNFI